ncbi:MAG: hypothetical protein OXE50_15480 [Chloroflexi bacterium]|nr:hypothetical protein [Chloroflexota bacterium]
MIAIYEGPHGSVWSEAPLARVVLTVDGCLELETEKGTLMRLSRAETKRVIDQIEPDLMVAARKNEEEDKTQ